jgi:parallel beta-helix repeat protein
VVLPLALFALSAVPALAVTSISSCAAAAVIISGSGNYVVTADLTAAPGADCIDITASNVSLALNGHVISGAPFPAAAASLNGINVFGTAAIRLNHVAIKGPGLVRGFGTFGFSGVSMSLCDYCLVESVTAAQNSIGIGTMNDTYLTLGSNVAAANTGLGISALSCSNCTIQYNDASGNSYGILTSSGSGNTVNNNTANGNTSFGIFISDIGTRVISNVTNGNGQSGISIAAGAAGNQVFNNPSSVGNGTFDLIDNNLPSCGTDFWSGNVFFTRSPVPCVK